MLTWLDKENVDFPSLAQALNEPNGLLAAGGDLTPKRLVAAYRHGCFPWFQEGQPILWWSPDPRLILWPEKFHVPKSLQKFIKKHQYVITIDQAFNQVIQACSEPRPSTNETWITQQIKSAYQELYLNKVAHSIEVWDGKQNLIGGLYGLAIGKIFFGESMFSRRANTSKIAFVFLVNQLKKWGFELIDCQLENPHLVQFGTELISRKSFAQHLLNYLDQPAHQSW